MDKQQKQTDELSKFKEDLEKFSKEQLVEMLVTYSILNSKLNNQIELQHVNFTDAVKKMSDSTVTSLDNQNEALKAIGEGIKNIRRENVGLWIVTAIESTLLAIIFLIIFL